MFTLEARQSDISHHQGLALVANGNFMSWIREGSDGKPRIKGRITSIEGFFWYRGGGMCYRGEWVVVDDA